MRTTLLGTSATLLSCVVALTAKIAGAQEPVPPPAAPATPPAALPVAPAAEAPAPAIPPLPGPAAPQPTAEAPVVAPAAPAEEETFPAAWFRIDSDLFGLQLWAGATHPLGEGIGLASDIYVTGSLGELDVGPAIATGPFTLTPMIGLQVDWASRRAAALVPQLYFTGGPDPIYLELWIQDYQNQLFDVFPNHDLYTRFFIDYKIGRYFGIGPQIEPWFALNDADDTRKKGLMSLAVGGNVMLTNYGKNATIFVYAAYETQSTARHGEEFPTQTSANGGFAGRLTFVHNF